MSMEMRLMMILHYQTMIRHLYDITRRVTVGYPMIPSYYFGDPYVHDVMHNDVIFFMHNDYLIIGVR